MKLMELTCEMNLDLRNLKVPEQHQHLASPGFFDKSGILDAIVKRFEAADKERFCDAVSEVSSEFDWLPTWGLKFILDLAVDAAAAKWRGTAPVPVKRDSATLPFRLPLLINPRVDQGLPLRAVFLGDFASGGSVQVAYVWETEHAPWTPIGDAIYQILRASNARAIGWERLKDMEYITLNFSDQPVDSPSSISFTKIYSGGRDWNWACPEHGSVTVGAEGIEFTNDGRPTIYANIWNHSLGERNSSGFAADQLIRPDAPVFDAYPGQSAWDSADLWAKDPDRSVAS